MRLTPCPPSEGKGRCLAPLASSPDLQSACVAFELSAGRLGVLDLERRASGPGVLSLLPAGGEVRAPSFSLGERDRTRPPPSYSVQHTPPVAFPSDPSPRGKGGGGGARVGSLVASPPPASPAPPAAPGLQSEKVGDELASTFAATNRSRFALAASSAAPSAAAAAVLAASAFCFCFASSSILR